jgi:hypothetical protein
MKISKKLACGIIAAMAAGLCAAPLWAQQEGEEKPKPAARVLLPLSDLSGDQQDTNQGTHTTQPDIGPVSGVQSPTLGTSELRHSYWVPGVQYGNTVQSGSSNPAVNSGWTTTNYVNGNLSLLEAWSHNLLSANYSGGGFFSKDQAQGSGQYHQLAAAFEIDQRRWQALFVDQFSYLPQSAFGFGGTSGLSFPGIAGTLAVPLPGLQNVYVPGQSILSASGPRYSNASAAQLTYEVSQRGSITVAGVHGLLRFSNAGNISGDTEIFNAGYNYAITRKDYLGMIYRFSAFHYPGDPQALGDHVAQFVYGRRITGRLALNLAGGPEVTRFRVPLNGSKQSVSGSGNGSLVYAFPLSTIRLSYSHGVTSGSGVFGGANTDQMSANWSRPLTRVWNGSFNFGYAKNRQIVTVRGLTSPTFDSWVLGAGLSRPLGRTANLSLGYQAQIQVSNLALCSTPNCGTNYTTHQILLSFQWHAAAQVLR